MFPVYRILTYKTYTPTSSNWNTPQNVEVVRNRHKVSHTNVMTPSRSSGRHPRGHHLPHHVPCLRHGGFSRSKVRTTEITNNQRPETRTMECREFENKSIHVLPIPLQMVRYYTPNVFCHYLHPGNKCQSRVIYQRQKH